MHAKHGQLHEYAQRNLRHHNGIENALPRPSNHARYKMRPGGKGLPYGSQAGPPTNTVASQADLEPSHSKARTVPSWS